MEKANEIDETVHSTDLPPKTPDSDGLINASGHRQELDRNFRLINICGLGITTGNTWIALGGSIVCKFCFPVAWEVSLMALRLSPSTMEDRPVSFTNCMFSALLSVLSSDMISMAACVFYWLIAASIAELASAMPSSGGGLFNRRSFAFIFLPLTSE
jgi:choline transport protein